MAEQQTIFHYWLDLWRDASPAGRRRGRIIMAVYLGLWLCGSFLAATQMAAVAAMAGLGKWLGALMVGPLGVLWQGLELAGLIVENPGDPGLGWLLPAGLHVGLLAAIYWLGSQPLNPAALHKRAAVKHRQSQGQLTAEEVAKKMPLKAGISLVVVEDRDRKPVTVGVDYATGQGHVLVIAPTRAGKGLQLTDVLTRWPGAAVVVDPKSEQYTRTAAFRQRHVGPVYRLPGHQIHLAHYYNFGNPDDIQELHDQLLRPEEDLQRIFADKSLPLFRAVGHFARARKRNPLRVLLDAAEDDFHRVLAGLDSVPEARPFVRQFTNGQPPQKVTTSDRFVTSAYGTFTTRLFSYQKHIDTICPRSPKHTLPREWVAQKATLFITYSLNELEGVGGVVAAILAGLMRDHMAHGKKQRLLVAIDEMAAVRLRHLETYLATVGGYGITLLLYAQSISQLIGVYGRPGAEAILSNCAHQLWYPPNDIQTAKHISDMYGTTLQPSRSFSTANRVMRQEDGQMRTVPQQSVSESLLETPTYSPTEVTALAKDKVFVFTEQGQQIRFIGRRLDPRAHFGQLPPPPPSPVLPTAPRQYTAWLPQSQAVVEKEATGAGSGDVACDSLPAATRAQPEDIEESDETAADKSSPPTDAETTDTRHRPPDDSTLI